MHGRPGGNWNNPRFGKSKKNFNKHPAAYRNPYPPAYGAATTGYQGGAYGSASGSKRPYPDMVNASHCSIVAAAQLWMFCSPILLLRSLMLDMYLLENKPEVHMVMGREGVPLMWLIVLVIEFLVSSLTVMFTFYLSVN